MPAVGTGTAVLLPKQECDYLSRHLAESWYPFMQISRKIIHLDMDCFYAAIEMRDKPALRNLPLAVGGRSDQRGVVATCNYVARAFGIHSAMATARALKLCPQLVVVPGRMSYYKEISEEIHRIFTRYTPLVESVGLDEAYLDVTDCTRLGGSATRLATQIRQTIKQELDLTASAGIAPNKFLAKIGSEMNKPDGQFALPPERVERFVRTLNLASIPGVGKATLKRLNANQLYTCGDVHYWDRNRLIRTFGSLGELLFLRSRGIDDRPVRQQRIRKSLSVEHTYPRDLPSESACAEALTDLFEELTVRLSHGATNRQIRTQQLKLKFNDFTSTTVERHSAALDFSLYRELLAIAWKRGQGRTVRLAGLGVGFKQLESGTQQLKLFE